MKKELSEIEGLINKKQFAVALRNARTQIKSLNAKNEEHFDSYIKLILYVADALEKNIKNLDALEELEKAHNLFPWEERILFRIYSLCIKLKRFPRAESALKDLVFLKPENIYFRIELARFFVNKKENSRAILELKKIIKLGVFNSYIYRHLIPLLQEEKLFFEMLENIRVLQKLEPENTLLIIEEARCLINMGELTKGLDLINKLLDYKLEVNLIDGEFVSSLAEFSDLYIKIDKKETLLEFYIQILGKGYEKFDKNVKLEIDNLTRKLKLEIFFNFVLNNNFFPLKSINYTEYNFVENITLLVKAKQRLNIPESQIRDYLSKLETEKLVSKRFACFLTALV